MSLSKLCDLTLCKKCSVSSQELTPFLMWFLWLFKRRLNPVSPLPMYCSLHVLHSMMYITQDDWQSREWNMVKILLLLLLFNVCCFSMFQTVLLKSPAHKVCSLQSLGFVPAGLYLLIKAHFMYNTLQRLLVQQ